ncbi:MAG: hypothetical protein WB491_01800 [Candidatus Aquilonibacter sp.]
MAAPTDVFNFYAIGSAYAQTVTLSEVGYMGAFTAGTQCVGIVTVSPLSNTQLSIVPIAAGRCILTFSDSAGNQSVPIYVEVTTTQVVGT